MPKFRGVYKDAKGAWYFKASTHKDPLTGKWAQVARRGFPTAAESATARENLIREAEKQPKATVSGLTVRQLVECAQAGGGDGRAAGQSAGIGASSEAASVDPEALVASGFEDLVSAAVGRRFIELPIAIPTQLWWPGFSSGPQTLTPERTIEYARTRKGVRNGDFSRSKHRGVIMLAVLTMLQQGSIEDVPVLLGELVKYSETNLTPTDLIQLGVAAFSMVSATSPMRCYLDTSEGRAEAHPSLSSSRKPRASSLTSSKTGYGASDGRQFTVHR